MKKDNVELICDVSELANLFQDSTNVDEFLQKVVQIVSNHMRADVCSIFLFNDQTQTLTLKATQGLNSKAIDKVNLKLGEGITGLALKELRPIRESNAGESPHFKFFAEIQEEDFEAFLAVPILRGISRVGVLTLQHRRADYFDNNDTKAFKAISNQLAATLENAKLLLDLKKRGDKLAPTQPEDHEIPDGESAKDLLTGNVASQGIAIGEAVVLGNRNDEVFLTLEDQQECTLEDFIRAVELTEVQIEELQSEMEDRLSDVASLIFSAHLLMLRDDEFSGSMKKLINQGENPPELSLRW